MIDVGLFLVYILFSLSALAAVFMPLYRALQDPQSIKKMLTGVLTLLAIFIVSFILADSTEYPRASATISKIAGTGLIAFYILSVGAIGCIIYTEIKKVIS